MNDPRESATAVSEVSAERRDETATPSRQGGPAGCGRYILREQIGEGSMGSVWLAEDPWIGRLVAVKILNTPRGLNEAQFEEWQHRFVREARAAGSLSHPGVIRIYDVGEGEDGSAYIVMERVEGRSLETILRDGPRVPPETALGWIASIAEALDAAHRKGIVHRDIKPGNILIDEEGRARIGDFGIARLSESELTHAGLFIGSPAFASPEQIRGELMDGRSDLFSLGALLYTLLAGERPFQNKEFAALTYEICHTHTPSPSRIATGLPSACDAIVAKALAKTPAHRYQSGREMAEDLRAVRFETSPMWVPTASSATNVAFAKPAGAEPPSGKGGPRGFSLAAERGRQISENLAEKAKERWSSLEEAIAAAPRAADRALSPVVSKLALAASSLQERIARVAPSLRKARWTGPRLLIAAGVVLPILGLTVIAFAAIFSDQWQAQAPADASSTSEGEAAGLHPDRTPRPPPATPLAEPRRETGMKKDAAAIAGRDSPSPASPRPPAKPSVPTPRSGGTMGLAVSPHVSNTAAEAVSGSPSSSTEAATHIPSAMLGEQPGRPGADGALVTVTIQLTHGLDDGEVTIVAEGKILVSQRLHRSGDPEQESRKKLFKRKTIDLPVSLSPGKHRIQVHVASPERDLDLRRETSIVLERGTDYLLLVSVRKWPTRSLGLEWDQAITENR